MVSHPQGLDTVDTSVSCTFSRLVDVFYMKSYSAQGVGLFCETNAPEAKHSLTPCGNQFCPCCFPVFHWKKTQPWTVVDFVSSSTHRFVNGYTTYLNRPAVKILRLLNPNADLFFLLTPRHVRHRTSSIA